MNRFIAKQAEGAAYTVNAKEAARQEIARQMAEFEQRQQAQQLAGGKSNYQPKRQFEINRGGAA